MKQNLYNLKSGFEVKDLDIRERKVAVYLSKFDSLDADFDIIRKGAFTKSLQERGVDSSSNRKIAFLRHHDWENRLENSLSLRRMIMVCLLLVSWGEVQWERMLSEIMRMASSKSIPLGSNISRIK